MCSLYLNICWVLFGKTVTAFMVVSFTERMHAGYAILSALCWVLNLAWRDGVINQHQSLDHTGWPELLLCHYSIFYWLLSLKIPCLMICTSSSYFLAPESFQIVHCLVMVTLQIACVLSLSKFDDEKVAKIMGCSQVPQSCCRWTKQLICVHGKMLTVRILTKEKPSSIYHSCESTARRPGLVLCGYSWLLSAELE